MLFLQGYARMSSVISPERWPDWEVLGLGGVFSVEWIKKESIPFHCTQHILNPWNDGKKVQISRDGQVGQRPDPRPCLWSFCRPVSGLSSAQRRRTSERRRVSTSGSTLRQGSQFICWGERSH